MDTDKIKIYGARVRVDSMAKVADIEAAEKDKMREKCDKILSHNINCFINRQLIYNFPEEIFADAGVMAIGECGSKDELMEGVSVCVRSSHRDLHLIIGTFTHVLAYDSVQSMPTSMVLRTSPWSSVARSCRRSTTLQASSWAAAS